jgi:hypothetical protein
LTLKNDGGHYFWLFTRKQPETINFSWLLVPPHGGGLEGL